MQIVIEKNHNEASHHAEQSKVHELSEKNNVHFHKQINLK